MFGTNSVFRTLFLLPSESPKWRGWRDLAVLLSQRSEARLAERLAALDADTVLLGQGDLARRPNSDFWEAVLAAESLTAEGIQKTEH